MTGVEERRSLKKLGWHLHASHPRQHMFVPSNHIGYNPTLLDMRNHHSNAIRCVGVGEECDGKVMQLLRGKVASDVFRGNICF